MILKGYFDGSGKSDDPQCRFVSLAGFVGPEDAWPVLEATWSAALEKHSAPIFQGSTKQTRYFHSKEAFASAGGYAGWTATQVASLRKELLNALAQGWNKLVGVSCTIDIADYKRAKSAIPSLRPIETLCIDLCCGQVFGSAEAKGGIEITFDRGEKFYGIVDKCWKQKVAGQRTWWADSVKRIEKVLDMKETYSLQAADLLAWSVNRYWTKGPNDQGGMLLFMMYLMNTQYHVMMNYEKLMKLFNDDGTMRQGISFPPETIQAPFVKV